MAQLGVHSPKTSLPYGGFILHSESGMPSASASMPSTPETVPADRSPACLPSGISLQNASTTLNLDCLQAEAGGNGEGSSLLLTILSPKTSQVEIFVNGLPQTVLLEPGANQVPLNFAGYARALSYPYGFVMGARPTCTAIERQTASRNSGPPASPHLRWRGIHRKRSLLRLRGPTLRKASSSGKS